MKLITLICLTLMFIGCAGQQTPPEDPRIGGDPDAGMDNPLGPPNIPEELAPGVASQTSVVCSNGAEDIVYTVKTYDIAQPCQHSRFVGRECVCEVSSAHPQFQAVNGVFAFATATKEWCEADVVSKLINGEDILIYSLRSGATVSEVLSTPHDASYACVRT